MKRFMKKWMALPILVVGCLFSVAGCSDDDDEKEAVKAEFNLDSETVNLSAEAINTAITYTLRNAGANSSFMVTSDQEWVKNFKTDVANKISFDVEANEETTVRQAEVTVVYSDDANEDIKTSFTVRQAASDLDFIITPGKTGSSWIQLSTTPKDESMRYMVAAVPVEDLDGYTSDQAFFENEMSSYQELADYFEIDLEFVLDVFLTKGSLSDATITLLEPETEYYIYCYGVDADYELATPIVKKKVTTPAATTVNNQIHIDVTETTSRSVTFNTTTTTPDSYVVVYASTEDIKEVTDEELKEELLKKDYVSSMQAGNVEDGGFTNLSPNTDYTILAMGRAGDVATTPIFKQEFKTKESVQADITYSLPDKKYFSAIEVQKVHPEMFSPDGGDMTENAIIASNIKADGAKSLYTAIFLQADIDATEEKNGKLTEEDYINLAMRYGQQYINILTIVPYNTPLMLVGVAFDANKNPSPVYTEKITITKDNVSPVSEFEYYLSAQKTLGSILLKSDASSMKSLLQKNRAEGSKLKPLIVKSISSRLKK